MVDRPDYGADLLREHVEGVRRLARHLVPDPDDAEDVAQESLLAAVRRTPAGIRNLGAWLRGIVRHKAVQHGRSEGRRRRHEGAVASPGAVGAPDEVVAGLEIQQRLLAAVKGLPAAYRTVLWRRYFEGVSARRIAADLGEPVETVRTRIKRGLARLRADMDVHCGGRRSAWTAALIPLLPRGGPIAALATKGALAIMSTKAVVIGAVAALAVVVLSVLPASWGAKPSAKSSPDAGPAPLARPERATEAVPPELRGLARAETEEPTVASGRSLRGGVFTQDGSPITGARVSVVQGSPGRVLGQGTTDAGGRYDVPLAAEHASGEEPRAVLVVAEADGFLRERREVDLQPGATRVDFVLGAGLAFAGWVVDVTGRPVRDLPVRLVTLGYPPHMIFGSLYWSEAKRLATDEGGYVEARARTDAGGRFEVRGLDTGRYGLISDDLRWFVKQEELVEVTRGRDLPVVRFLALPARAVTGRVTNAATGERLVKGHVEMMLHAPDSDSMGSGAAVLDGRYLAGWSLDDELSGYVEVKVTASADGYKDASASGSLDPEHPILTLDLSVEPIVEEHGEVVLTAVEPRGAPFPGLVDFRARRKDDPRVNLLGRPVPEGNGVFRFSLPAGKYDVTVEPFHLLGHYAAGRVEVEVLPREEVAASVVLGGGATLRVRLPRVDALPATNLMVRAVGERTHHLAGASTDLTPEEDQILAGEELVWAGFLPGTWRFELTWGERKVERTIHLEEGDDQTLDLR